MIDVVIAFFILGLIASASRSNFEFPKELYQSLSIFLMLAIGLKGGIALAAHSSSGLIWQSIAVVMLGICLPFIAFPILRKIGGLNREDSASIAAHYGSVSVGTYAVAIAVLEANNISYEAYFPLFVVLLEMPAIAVGLAMADKKLLNNSGKVAHEIFTSQGILLMVGGLIIGAIFADSTNKIMPLFGGMFHGALALFLLQMGLIAGKRLFELKDTGLFILSFGILMPMIGAVLGGAVAYGLGFSPGGIILLAVLGASSSYIAVPAAMTAALPNANHSLSITSSLGITFPFNVLVGIPVYVGLVKWFSAV